MTNLEIFTKEHLIHLKGEIEKEIKNKETLEYNETQKELNISPMEYEDKYKIPRTYQLNQSEIDMIEEIRMLAEAQVSAIVREAIQMFYKEFMHKYNQKQQTIKQQIKE